MNLYSTLVQWATMRLIFIFQWFLGLQSQSIDFTNAFAQSDIPIGEPVFIGIPRDFNIDGGKGNVVIILKKSLYVKTEAAHLWYKICEIVCYSAFL